MSGGAPNASEPPAGQGQQQQQLPDMWLPHVVRLVEELHQSGQLAAGGAALLQPRLRPVFARLCPAVVAAYTVVAAAGSVTCLAAARAIYRRGAPPTAGCGPLLTLLAGCLANCLLVLPLTLTVLLLQNWVLGSTMCYMLPIMQLFFGDLRGVGLCMVNVGRGVGPLTKVLFVTTYILPLLLMGLLQLFISQGLAERRSGLQAHSDDEPPCAATVGTVHRCSYVTDASRETDQEADGLGEPRRHVLDLAAEAAAHKYTLAITLAYALCLCPLMVLSGDPKLSLRTPAGRGSRDGQPGLLGTSQRERRKHSVAGVSVQLLQLVVPGADTGYRLAGED
ncbi:hypothetical protein FJT64_000170 [Amphibalanus amphitrite]|uniref:G-protein coupled receptors family 1 profile domain-containing protein n=1 Tax=Amphibalanus amphitrite TaxID=1232801 RepID=A0A6A4VMK9_AMPAM|nr:hypothetical protein FJT64_000170 [Amphibalanus amphitrite]